jgi:aryl-alcohol dehydrogenase-like predicted oxidoreductase
MHKIALGTVQFGMSYGVSNQLGKTDDLEVKKILKYASQKDISMLDTAALYGSSESLIGNLTHKNDKKWDIVTKIPNFEDKIINDKQVKILIENFNLSLTRIGKKNIYGLLLHSCDNLFLTGGHKLLEAMMKLKEEGLVKKIGVSLYSGNQIGRILDNYSIDLVQLPVNILDQRLLDSGHLKTLKKYNVEIHARSVFLQGLLLMQISDIPSWFNPIKGVLNAFHKEANRRGISALQLALCFVQSINEVDKVVVGVNTWEQLHQIIESSSLQVDISDFSNLSISDENFLNPSNWRL